VRNIFPAIKKPTNTPATKTRIYSNPNMISLALERANPEVSTSDTAKHIQTTAQDYRDWFFFDQRFPTLFTEGSHHTPSLIFIGKMVLHISSC
jgi:hypothetical protein